MSRFVTANVLVIAECRRMVKQYHGQYTSEVKSWLEAMTKEQAVMCKDIFTSLARGIDERKLNGKVWEFEEAWQEQPGKPNLDPHRKYRAEVEDQWRRDRRGK